MKKKARSGAEAGEKGAKGRTLFLLTDFPGGGILAVKK
jgi:hypothetical protein